MKIGIRSSRDFWSGVLFTLTGIGFAVGAQMNYAQGTAVRPGPGYFPVLLGACLTILGLLIVASALTGKPRAENQSIGPIAWKPFLIITGSITLFGFLLPRVGLFIALPLLVILGSLAGSEFKLPTVLITAAVLTIGSWAVFVLGLGLIIPLWPNFIGG